MKDVRYEVITAVLLLRFQVSWNVNAAMWSEWFPTERKWCLQFHQLISMTA